VVATYALEFRLLCVRNFVTQHNAVTTAYALIELEIINHVIKNCCSDQQTAGFAHHTGIEDQGTVIVVHQCLRQYLKVTVAVPVASCEY